jgi:lipopolysaccharide biosynthesis glycosyltransferase
MHLVLCCDENYARHAAVVIASALENLGTSFRPEITLLTPGLKPETEAGVLAVVERKGASASIVTVEEAPVDPWILRRFGLASVLRLLMHRYLPVDASRAIYLDCDMAVLGDLGELWSASLAGMAVGAVRDISGDPDEHAAITSPYFNSGLLVVDLDAWRLQEIGDRCLRYLAERGGELRYPDQDALNHLLAGNWLELDPRWNLQSSIYGAIETQPDHLAPVRAGLVSALHSPGVIHYTGDIKPWDPMSRHPLRDIFRHYSGLTAWPLDAREMARDMPLRTRIRLALKEARVRRRRKLTNWVP